MWFHIFVKVSMSLGIDLASVEKLRQGKTRNKKQATCLATLLQKELNNGVARFTTHINLSCNKSGCWQVWTSMVKHATPLFNSFCPKFGKTSCTFSFRLRAVSLFCSPSSKTRDTQMATRVRPRFARCAASPLPRACIALTKSEEIRCPFYRSFRWHCRPNNWLSSE